MKRSCASYLRRLLAFTALLALCACRASVAPPGDAATQKNLAPPQSQQKQQTPTAVPSLCHGQQSPLPKPSGFVNDFAKVIDAGTKTKLESRLAELKESSGVEFAVVTVETTGGRDIFDYSIDVACGWGIGPPADKPGGGLLLLVAIKDHKWRVQVGRRLEADLPDDVVKEFGDRMAASFKRGEHDRGLTDFVEETIARLAERGKVKTETLDIR